MYIFFGSTGAVSNIDIDDEDLVQGSVNANNLYVYHVGKPNLSYTATVTFERSDGELSPERTLTPYTFTYETVEYAGYHFLFDDEWILAKSGELKATVRLRNGAGVVLATGLITAPVEQTVYDAEPNVTITQYNDLQANLASKADKSQTIIHVATFANIPALDGGEYDNWMFVLDDGTVYRIDTDTATFVGKIGENCKYVKSTEILAKGDVVQFTNATGGFVLVKKAVSAEINVYPQLVLGLAMHAFTANGFGLILMQGKLDGINTSSGTDGVYIYANSSSETAGLWTVTRPVAPNVAVVLGAISNASANGSIDVRLSVIPKMSTLSDVYAPSLAQDDVIKWNATSGRWEVSKELSVYKYLGSFATADLAVASVSAGSTGVLYECLINGVPYEAIKSGTGNVQLINLSSNKSTFYSNGVITYSRDGMLVYNAQPVDSPANTVPEIYRNSFRPIMTAANIGACVVTRGSYGGVATTEYAYIFFLSTDVAIITVGARTWKYSYSADTFTEYYLTKTDAQSTYIALTEKGSANGVAPLGSDSKVPAPYLPSYVDDILEYTNLAAFPATGETGKIYVAKDTNLTYRWTGSAYIEISQSLALGETSETAYRGDRGKTAYDHSQLADGSNPHATTFANIQAKPTTMGGYGITDGIRVISNMSTTLSTAYTTLGRQIAINGADDSYVLVLFPDVAAPSTYNGRFYCGSSRIGVRAFRQLSSSATIQQAFDASVASAKQDCYELITGSDFALLIGVTSLYNQGLYEIKDSSSATYKYGSRYSLSYYGGATLLALPDAIVSGLDAKADKVSLTNLITNGDFNSLTGWTASSSSNSISNNILTHTASGAYNFSVLSTNITITSGNLFHIRVNVKANNSLISYITIRVLKDGTTPTPIDYIYTPTINTWYEKSYVIRLTPGSYSTYSLQVLQFYPSAGDATGQSIDCKYFTMIDETACFGSGSEPVLATADILLKAKYPLGWFDGTVAVYGLAEIIKLINDFSGSEKNLFNKLIYNFGDSIAYGSGGTSYATEIATRNGMTLTQYASSGYYIRVRSVGATDNVVYKVDNAASNASLNYILLEGGINDVYNGGTPMTVEQKGSISSGYSATLDTATFCGAFEYILKTCKTKWPQAKLLFVFTHNTDAREAVEQLAIHDLQVSMLKKWSIAYVDLYENGGLNTNVSALKTAYSTDGLHPNTTGYQLFYTPQIEAKLKTL